MCRSQACDPFGIYFKYISGEEQATKLPLPSDAQLKLKGRIRFDTLASYLPAMKKSARKKLSLVEVHPVNDGTSTQCYNAFCQYYRDLNRGAVIDLEKQFGVTMYVMPVVEKLSVETREKLKVCFNCPPLKASCGQS